MVPAFAYSLYLTLYKTDISLRRTLSAGPKGVRLGERCPSYKELNKGNKQRQGPTLGVRPIEVSVKRESTVCPFLVGYAILKDVSYLFGAKFTGQKFYG